MRLRHGRAHSRDVVRRREFSGDTPGEHNRDPIADIEQFVEVRRHQQDRASPVSSGAQRTPDESGGADVEPARGLRRDGQSRIGVDLAREDHLLGVAAGERTRFLCG